MLKSILIFFAISCLASVAFGQKKAAPKTQKVRMEIITTDQKLPDSKPVSKIVTIDWPFSQGPLPAGGETIVLKQIDALLKANGVECPPKRTPLGDNIWLCGDGTKIKTTNAKLLSILKAAWSGNE